MITIGIYSTTFGYPTLEANLDAISSHGLTAVQFNLGSAGLATLPDHIDPGPACPHSGGAGGTRHHHGRRIGNIQHDRSQPAQAP